MEKIEEGISEQGILLVKYISQSGFLSRRKSEEAIKTGHAMVNGSIMVNPGYVVKPTDKVYVDGTEIVVQKKIYIVLNKPVAHITSKDDPEGRKTVFDLFPTRMARELDPVGRLDYNTSGVLLLSNDGSFINMLSHPRYKVPKIYSIYTSRPLTDDVIAQLKKGGKLDDGMVRPDLVEWNPDYPSRLTLHLHSGKYRVIRRLLELFGIFVDQLHRVSFAGVTIKGIPVGAWRSLSGKEYNDICKLAEKKSRKKD